MIPSYFKIEILAIRDEFVTLGHKGLTCLYSDHISLKYSNHGVHRSIYFNGCVHACTVWQRTFLFLFYRKKCKTKLKLNEQLMNYYLVSSQNIQ